MTKIDLKQRFKQELCTPQMAQLINKTLPGNKLNELSHLAYDSKGELNDGGWLSELGFNDFSPALNFTNAICLLDSVQTFDGSVEVEFDDRINRYIFKYKDLNTIFDENLVDGLLRIWLTIKE